jgi:hypothetical protein
MADREGVSPVVGRCGQALMPSIPELSHEFHQAGAVVLPDEEGLELPDIDAAQEEAALSLADMARCCSHIEKERSLNTD